MHSLTLFSPTASGISSSCWSLAARYRPTFRQLRFNPEPHYFRWGDTVAWILQSGALKAKQVRLQRIYRAIIIEKTTIT